MTEARQRKAKASRPVTFAICGAGSRGLESYPPYAEQHPDEASIVAVAEPREWYRNEAVRRYRIPAQGKPWNTTPTRSRRIWTPATEGATPESCATSFGPRARIRS